MSGGANGTKEHGSTSSARRTQNIVVAIATIGGFLFGYDTGVISGALLYISDDLALSPAMESVVVSSLLVGAAFGGTFGGRISDAIGRRRVITIAAVLFCLGTLGCALAGGAGVMIASRVVLGLAVGAVSAVVPLYIGEIAPISRRGRLVNQNELMIVTGQLSASVVNAIIANAVDDPHVWRWMLGAALIPAVALFIGVRFIPDSPRFLVSKQRNEEALAALRELRTPEDAEAELAHIREGWEEHKNDPHLSPSQFLRIRWVFMLILIGIGVSLCQQLAGVNAVVYYAPTLLTDSGLAADAAVTGNIAIGVMGVTAVVIGMVLVGRYDRRPMLMIGQLGVAACHLVIVGLFLLPGSTGISFTILAVMVVFIFFQQCFISTVTWLVLAELFPMKVRGFAMGVSVFFQWTANVAVSLAFPNLADSFGPPVAFGMFVVLSLAGFVFTRFALPETRSSSLEDLERRFKKQYSR